MVKWAGHMVWAGQRPVHILCVCVCGTESYEGVAELVEWAGHVMWAGCSPVHTMCACVQNAFELYGADFMISEDYTPWMLEVNSSPGMLPTSVEKTRLCAAVIRDTFKGRLHVCRVIF